MPATIVDVRALFDVVVYALAAGLTVSVAFALAIHGAVRSGEMRAAGRTGAAGAFGALALAGLALVAIAVVVAIVVITSK